MCYSPCFQNLPSRIIDRIIEYSLEPFALDEAKSGITSRSILHSCQKWRTRFTKHACSQLTLECRGSSRSYFSKVETPESNFAFVFPRWPSAIGMPTFPTCHLVKKLFVFANSWDTIFDGSFLKFAEGSQFGTAKLESVQSLSIQVSDYRSSIEISGSELTLAAQNVQSFLKHICGIARDSASRVELTWTIPKTSTEFEIVNIARYNAIAPSLYKASQISINEYGESQLKAGIDPANFSGLTHLCYHFNTNYALLLDITRRNALTLQELTIEQLQKPHVGLLLQNSDGSPVVYSSMKTLRLGNVLSRSRFQDSAEQMELSEYSGNFAHFPALKDLIASGEYPFNVNVLKRGVDVSLESLSIPIACEASDHMETLKSFSTTRFANLKAVTIDREDDDCASFSQPDGEGDHQDQDIEIKRFFNTSLAQSNDIRHFSFKGNIQIDGLLSSSFFAVSLKNVISLQLKSTHITLSNAIRILQHCWALKTFTAVVGFGIPEICNANNTDLYQYARETYFPLNNSL
ncbi:hypothetical protein LPJ75_003285, partial [Coemansia sp. RSA 2598]